MSSAVLPPPSAPLTDVNSMLSSLPADIMSGASDIAIPASEESTPQDDTPVDDTPSSDDTPADSTPVIGDESAGDEPVGDEPVSAEPVDPNAPPVAEPTEEMDEGTIKVKDAKSGKYQYRLDANRYAKVYGNHQLVQQATNEIGEPLTVELVKELHDRSIAHERLWDHLTSGDPVQQGYVMNEFIKEMKEAHTNGETGVDPSVSFASTVYDTLRDQAPEAYNSLRFQAAKDTVSDMFQMAASTNDPLLFGSAQRFAATIAGVGPKPADMSDAQYATQIREATARAEIPFYTMNEMEGLSRGEDPVAALTRRNQQLEAQLNQRTGSTAAERYSQWQTSHRDAVNTAVFKDAVQPALASVADAWKDFPDDYQRLVVDPLNREVTKAVREDSVLDQQVKDLNAKARRATSESVRQQIGDQIKQLFVNRAKLAAERAKAPIVKFAAEAVKGRTTNTNQRRAAAQTRTAPQGTGTPVRQSVLPPDLGFKNGLFDSATAMKQALAVLR
jgi:hypothetical protein